MTTETELKSPSGEAVPSNAVLVCPGCGGETPDLHEGYCDVCSYHCQQYIDEHYAALDRWQKLTEAEREREIKQAY